MSNLSEFRKMKIKLYLYIYKKIHEIIVKYYWLNLFKGITNDFKYDLKTPLESPTRFFDSLLV